MIIFNFEYFFPFLLASLILPGSFISSLKTFTYLRAIGLLFFFPQCSNKDFHYLGFLSENIRTLNWCINFTVICVCVLSCVQVLVTPWTDYSPSGYTVHGVFQARILEWVAISYSRGSSQPRGWTCVSFISYTGRQILYHHLGSPVFHYIQPIIITKNPFT